MILTDTSKHHSRLPLKTVRNSFPDISDCEGFSVKWLIPVLSRAFYVQILVGGAETKKLLLRHFKLEGIRRRKFLISFAVPPQNAHFAVFYVHPTPSCRDQFRCFKSCPPPSSEDSLSFSPFIAFLLIYVVRFSSSLIIFQRSFFIVTGSHSNSCCFVTP